MMMMMTTIYCCPGFRVFQRNKQNVIDTNFGVIKKANITTINRLNTEA